ncbi:hypothetical protein L7F22_016936 [Adiantum nelumboides]|nr:hypothetical protein [Adiantum nelumboides]
MDSNEGKLLLGSGSFLTEDSFELSDYLHCQAERAGNRLFSNKNPLLFLRSKFFSAEFEEKEEKKILDRCYPSVFKSMALETSASAQKASSGSYMGKECSSLVSSELEQQGICSSSSLKPLTYSDSCIESSQCCEFESVAEAATTIDVTKVENLHNNLLCYESKEAISIDSSEIDAEEGPVDGFLTTIIHGTEALDLLAIVAMQDNESDAFGDAALRPSRGAVSQSESQSPAPRSNTMPIVKKRVIRRAKSAFQRQIPEEATRTRLKYCESATRKENDVSEWCMQEKQNTPSRHKVHTAYAKRRKLQELSSSPLDASVKACTNEDLEENCSVDKDQSNGCLNEVAKAELAEIGKVVYYNGVSQKLSSRSPSSFGTKIPQIMLKHGGNNGNVVHYRKLQLSSSRLLDACHVEQANVDWLNCEAFKDISKACLGMDLNRNPSFERGRGADFISEPSGDMKHGSSSLRLKILPIRQPGADLASLQDVSKFSTEGRMLTRRRSAQQRMEKESMCASSMVLSSSMQQTAIQMVDTQITDTHLVMQTKRGRSQVRPTKFSDSVLQPWTGPRKKIWTS